MFVMSTMRTVLSIMWRVVKIMLWLLLLALVIGFIVSRYVFRIVSDIQREIMN